ncbi:MAG: SLC13 family permease [Luteitalea sp.]|nr:SLC13 family permease [Luteitalea sp.]
MTWEAWFTLAVLVSTIVALVRDVAAPAAVVLGAIVVLLLVEVVTVDEAFAGFSNPAPLTVGALYVLARAIEKTGALQPLITAALGSGDGARVGLARLLIPAACASAFLNNTPIVAMLAPQVAAWASRRGQPVSRFLMPLSFAAILGGTVTVLGTSTNIVVSGLLQADGQAPLGIFEISPVGLPVACVGLVALLMLAPILLPDRRTASQQFEEDIREFAVSMNVAPGGPLHGRTVEQAGLRHLHGVFLVEVQREGEFIAPVSPDTTLHGGDRLMFVGRADLVADLQSTRGLVSTEQQHAAFVAGPNTSFFEAVVSEASPLAGKSLRESGFRARYQAAVLAIHRAGARVRAKLGDVVLKPGDTLLLLADAGFRSRWRDRNDFLLVSRLDGAPPPTTPRQAALVGAITVGIVLTAATGLFSIVQASLAGALALVAFRVMTPAEARSAVNIEVLVVIAAAFGLGAAVTTSGLAEVVAQLIVLTFDGWGTLGLLLAIAVTTVLFTEVITNNAAAVLMFPIAMATASRVGEEPRLFAIVVAIAASLSFLSPLGYQTNTMVYGPGGYRFGDYARLGLPLSLLVLVVLVTTSAVFWAK